MVVFFRPPDSTGEYISLLEKTKLCVENLGDETASKLITLSNKKYYGHLLRFLFKIVTAGWVIWTVTSILARLLQGVANVILASVEQLSPYLAGIFGIGLIIILWEFLSAEIGEPDMKTSAFRRLRFWRRKKEEGKVQEVLESEENRAVELMGRERNEPLAVGNGFVAQIG